MGTMIDNPYEVLAVGQDASQKEIRAAYRVAAKRYHPDAGGSADAARFDAATRAFETLRDPESRRRLDQWLAAEQAGAPRGGTRPDSAEPWWATSGSTATDGAPGPGPAASNQWWVHNYPGRDSTTWSRASGSTFQWPNRFAEQSPNRNVSQGRPPRPPRERFPLLGRLERRNLRPSLVAGVVVAVFYVLLSLFRFDPGIALAVKLAAAEVGPLHVVSAFVAATLVAWSALGVRPHQRAAVVVSSILVVGGAVTLTVVRNAWMWGAIAFIVFLAVASRSRPAP